MFNSVLSTPLRSEAVVRRCSVKKLFLEILQYSQENKYEPGSLFFNKVAGHRPATLAQLFYCEFCEISKNTFFDRTQAQRFVLMFSF